MEGRRKKIFEKIKSNTFEKGSCWIWKGSNSGIDKGCRSTRGAGYGRISIDGATMAVHRVMWSIINGPIAHKKQIDHICRNRLCVNPSHLEQVTHKQNQRRRDNKK